MCAGCFAAVMAPNALSCLLGSTTAHTFPASDTQLKVISSTGVGLVPPGNKKYSVVSCFFLYWVDHMTTSIQEAFITMCRNLWYLDKNPQKLNIYIVYTQRRLFISRCLHVPVLWLFKGLGVFARSWIGTEFNRRFVQWNTRCSRLLGHLDLPKMAAWFSGSRLTANIH